MSEAAPATEGVRASVRNWNSMPDPKPFIIKTKTEQKNEASHQSRCGARCFRGKTERSAGHTA